MAADATARFNVEMGASTPGVDATISAAERLRDKIVSDERAIKDLQKALRNLQGGASVNVDTMRSLKTQLEQKKAAVAASSEKLLSLGGSFSKVKKDAKDVGPAAEEAAGGTKGLLDVFQAAGGPAGSLSGHLKNLGQTLTQLGPGGLIAVAAVAVLVLVSALVVGTVALMKFALAAADTRRSAQLLHEASTGSAQGARELGDAVSALSSKISTPRAEIEKTADELARAGLRGQALRDALFAVGVAGDAAGSQAQSALQGIITKAQDAGKVVLSEADLKNTGLALEDVGAVLAQRLGITTAQAVEALKSGTAKLDDAIGALRGATEARFGDIAARKALGFTVQIDKAKEHLSALFAGVKIEGFLVALHKVLSLLDENTVSGKALKAVVETILNPLFAAASAAGPYIRAFFEGMIIVALGFAIVVVKVRNALRDAFGGPSTSSIFTLQNAMKAGQIVAAALLGALTALAVVLAVVVVGAALLALPFLLAAAAIAAVGYAIGWVIGKCIEFWTWLFQLQDAAISAGADMIGGLVTSLVNGAGAVVDAVKSLASQAINALFNTLQTHSDSRLTLKAGLWTAGGLAHGIEKGTDEVEAAAQDAGAAAIEGTGQGLATGGDGGGGGGGGNGAGESHLHFSFGDLYIGGRKAVREPDLETELADLFGRAVRRAGLMPA